MRGDSATNRPASDITAAIAADLDLLGRSARPRANARMAGGGARLPHPGAARACARKCRRPRRARRVRFRRGGASRRASASRISTIWPRNMPTSTCAFSTGRRPANPSGSTRTGCSSRRPCSTSRPGTSVTISSRRIGRSGPDDHLVVELRFLAFLFAQAKGRDDLAEAARFMDEHLLRWTGRFAKPRGGRNATPLLCGGSPPDAWLTSKSCATILKRQRTCPGLPRRRRSKAPTPSSPARTR